MKNDTVADQAVQPITDRVKTMADVLAIQGITQEEFTTSCAGLRDHEIAGREIELLAKTLNEGEEMKTADTSQTKFFPWFWVNKDSDKFAGFSLSYVDYDHSRANAGISARLGFKTSQLAKYAGNQFTSLYERHLV